MDKTATTLASQMLATKLDRDHKRAVDARRKYAWGKQGGGPGSNRLRPAPPGGLEAFPMDDGQVFYNLWAVPRDHTKARTKQRRALHYDHHLGDRRPEDWDAVTPLDAVSPVDDYYYSYDRPTGPSAGSAVLGAALDKAVARFENQATETLVKTEYNLVDARDEAEDERVPVQDEDFELI